MGAAQFQEETIIKVAHHLSESNEALTLSSKNRWLQDTADKVRTKAGGFLSLVV